MTDKLESQVALLHGRLKQMTELAGEMRDQMRLMAPQPAPTKTDSPEVWPQVVAELRALADPVSQRLADLGEARDAFGREKYGKALQVENGRDPAVDLLQEALDALVYARQLHAQLGTDATRSAFSMALTLARFVVREFHSQ